MQPAPGPIDWIEHSKFLRRTYRGKYVILSISRANVQERDENGDMVFLGGWIPRTYRAFELGARYEKFVYEGMKIDEIYNNRVWEMPDLYMRYLDALNDAPIPNKFLGDSNIRRSADIWIRHRNHDLALTSENIKELFKWYCANWDTHKRIGPDEQYYIAVLKDFLMPEDIFSTHKLSMDIPEEEEKVYIKEAQDLLDAAEDGMWLMRGSRANRNEGVENLKIRGERYYTLGLRYKDATNFVRVEYDILRGWTMPGILESSSLMNMLDRIEGLDITKALVF